MSDVDAHLLIVDDDERIRDLLKKFLMRSGFLVTAARDAAHARRVLSGLDFDLIVMDVMMPGEDGVSLTRALRETHDTPILLLTAARLPLRAAPRALAAPVDLARGLRPPAAIGAAADAAAGTPAVLRSSDEV